MPRVYTSQNDPLDFCTKHFPSEQTATEQYAGLGDGPDNRGNCFTWDAEHPPYTYSDGYRCETCNEPLTELDDTRTRRH